MSHRLLISVLCLVVPNIAAFADPVAELRNAIDTSVNDWKHAFGDILGAEAPQFNDSSWQTVQIGHEWRPHDSRCWFRKTIIVPDRIGGVPVKGGELRLRVGIDNGGKAYVNGALAQQFKWNDGDVLLTDNAQPSTPIVVAIHAYNEPGIGRFMNAWLTLSLAEPMLAPLRDFVEELEIAQSDLRYRPHDFAAQWHDIIERACKAVRLDALQTADQDAFLASLNLARSTLLEDGAKLEGRLAAVQSKLEALKEKVNEGRAQGLDLAYTTAQARVIESFIQYARDDWNDPARGRQVRALKIAQYLESLSDDAIATMDAILGDPQKDRRVPRYHTGPVQIRNGAFYQDGAPMFFTGVGHFGQVRQDTPILNDYGLNIIQIEMGPWSVVKGPDETDPSPIQTQIVDALDNAARHNVTVNLLISPHYFPQWAEDRNPDKGKCGMNFIKNCIDSPEARSVYERYLRELMPRIARHPALHSICLSNEPQYIGRCEHSRRGFQRWLEMHHGTVKALNRAHGTGYRAFDEVPIPENDSNFPLHVDFCRYNQDRFLAFHHFLRDLVHEYNRDIPVHAKVMSHAFEDPGRYTHGINREDFNLIGTISGNDCIQTFVARERGDYAQGWLNMALNYTLQRSVAPANPVFNSEAHIIVDGDTQFVPGSHIRTAYYTMAIHGQGAATTWIWERGQGGDAEQNLLTRPECVLALGTIGLDLNRLGSEILALQNPPQEVAVLYAQSSLPVSMAHVTEASAAFEGLYLCDTSAAFVTERQAAAGKLHRYKLVVVPAVSHVTDDTVLAFERYLEAGGRVVFAGECFTHDEYGRPRLISARIAESTNTERYPGGLTARAYREIMNSQLDRAGVRRPVRLYGEHGVGVWGVNLRWAENANGLLVSLVNFTREPRTVVLEPAPEMKSPINLFTNETVTFPLELNSLDPVLLRIERTADHQRKQQSEGASP